MDSTVVQIYLTRRNLLTLLSKLDRNKVQSDSSLCTLYKRDNQHKTYPQSHPVIVITALEDEVYYTDRECGPVHPLDEPNKENR